MKNLHTLYRYFKKVNHYWIYAWIIIYAGFLVSAAFWPNSHLTAALRYGGILSCFIYAVYFFRHDSLLSIALGFTLLADTLLLLDNISILGIFVFCLAQFFHMARFRHTSTVTFFWYFLYIIMVFFAGVVLGGEPMIVICNIYGASIVVNIVLSRFLYKGIGSVHTICAFFGFILFFTCDFFVACSYFSITGSLPIEIYAPANYLAWLFYFPSQVLIANSSLLGINQKLLHKKLDKSAKTVLQ